MLKHGADNPPEHRGPGRPPAHPKEPLVDQTPEEPKVKTVKLSLEDAAVAFAARISPMGQFWTAGDASAYAKVDGKVWLSLPDRENGGHRRMLVTLPQTLTLVVEDVDAL